MGDFPMAEPQQILGCQSAPRFVVGRAFAPSNPSSSRCFGDSRHDGVTRTQSFRFTLRPVSSSMVGPRVGGTITRLLREMAAIISCRPRPVKRPFDIQTVSERSGPSRNGPSVGTAQSGGSQHSGSRKGRQVSRPPAPALSNGDSSFWGFILEEKGPGASPSPRGPGIQSPRHPDEVAPGPITSLMGNARRGQMATRPAQSGGARIAPPAS